MCPVTSRIGHRYRLFSIATQNPKLALLGHLYILSPKLLGGYYTSYLQMIGILRILPNIYLHPSIDKLLPPCYLRKLFLFVSSILPQGSTRNIEIFVGTRASSYQSNSIQHRSEIQTYSMNKDE